MNETIEYPRDYQIVHNNNKRYNVNPLIMSTVSEKFKKMYFENKPPQLVIEDIYSDSIFELFIKLCHSIHVDYDLAEIMELKHLAKEWEASPVIKFCKKKIKETSKEARLCAKLIIKFKKHNELPNSDILTNKNLQLLLQSDEAHFLPQLIISILLTTSKEANIDSSIINAFIISHIYFDPKSSKCNSSFHHDLNFHFNPIEFIQYLNPTILTDSQLTSLYNDSRIHNISLIKDEFERRHPNAQITVSVSEESKVDNSPKPFRMKPPHRGIFASFSVDSPKGPVFDGAVRVSSSSNDPKSFLNFSNGNTFLIKSIDGKPPSLTIFLKKQISLTQYNIQIGKKEQPLKWVLSGSNDGKTFQEIKREDHGESMLSPSVTVPISLDEPSPPYSIFQISSNSDYLSISTIELIDSNEKSILRKGINTNLQLIKTSNNYLHRLVSTNHRKMWFSTYGPKEWIQFEFTRNLIIPSKYTIKTGSMWFPKGWYLMGSLDGNKWAQLDKRTNVSALNAKHVCETFTISSTFKCKFLRFQQIGKSWDNLEIFCISGIEFFGEIRSDESSTENSKKVEERKAKENQLQKEKKEREEKARQAHKEKEEKERQKQKEKEEKERQKQKEKEEKERQKQKEKEEMKERERQAQKEKEEREERERQAQKEKEEREERERQEQKEKEEREEKEESENQEQKEKESSNKKLRTSFILDIINKKLPIQSNEEKDKKEEEEQKEKEQQEKQRQEPKDTLIARSSITKLPSSLNEQNRSRPTRYFRLLSNQNIKSSNSEDQQPKTDEIKIDEIIKDEIIKDEIKKDEMKTDEIKTDEIKTDEFEIDDIQINEKKDNEKKDNEKKDNEKKDNEKKDNEKKDNEKKDNEKKDNEKKKDISSDDFLSDNDGFICEIQEIHTSDSTEKKSSSSSSSTVELELDDDSDDSADF